MASGVACAPFLLHPLRLSICCLASVSSQMTHQWPKQASVRQNASTTRARTKGAQIAVAVQQNTSAGAPYLAAGDFTATCLRLCLCLPTAHACNKAGNRNGQGRSATQREKSRGIYRTYEAIQAVLYSKLLGNVAPLNSVLPKHSWFMLTTVDALPKWALESTIEAKSSAVVCSMLATLQKASSFV